MKALVLSLAFAATALAAENKNPAVMAIGSPVPDFELPGIDGKNHKLAEYESAKVLCLIFTCNHCPDAIAAAVRMEEIHQAYKDKGVAVVAINSSNPLGLRPDELGYGPHGDSFEEMTPFAKENGWTFPYLYDGETQTLSATVGAQSTPHVFIFGEDRKLAYTGRMDDAARKTGPVEKSYVRDALDALLAGKPVATPTTRSFGCSTKWLWKKDEVAADQKNWEAKPVTLEKLDVETAKKLRENKSGNVRLINFWSTTCGPCVAEFPDLVDAYRRFQNRSFDFVTISLDPVDDQAKALKFLEKQHAALGDRTKASMEKEGRKSNNYLFAGDNPDLLAEAIDKEWTGAQPHTVLVSPEGEILWRHTGAVDPVEMRRQIVKAMEGMP
ncbi:redoxin domain-containing protein [Luteolibacter flavescens]|uniref:Redoxin domain-containing protein n=1 Tax=Luteolibacter flavescens TaxID=1859460 RepID=A0ABT3FLQ0_9BACT|nr:redoxin domain-containing protein [Luteolibacter flavescens]MCW1884499.1 redoxin domain-containing protein [Luteolibacter flavescens]